MTRYLRRSMSIEIAMEHMTRTFEHASEVKVLASFEDGLELFERDDAQDLCIEVLQVSPQLVPIYISVWKLMMERRAYDSLRLTPGRDDDEVQRRFQQEEDGGIPGINVPVILPMSNVPMRP